MLLDVRKHEHRVAVASNRADDVNQAPQITTFFAV
jgi:hypothetical protein